MREELVHLLVRILTHREHFQREQLLESKGWKVKQGKLLIDGYEDPETGETLDIETAFVTQQAREVIEKWEEQEARREHGTDC